MERSGAPAFVWPDAGRERDRNAHGAAQQDRGAARERPNVPSPGGNARPKANSLTKKAQSPTGLKGTSH